ncbi:hypothetical protein GCM10022221_59910 [Actinocorallia aurea]
MDARPPFESADRLTHARPGKGGGLPRARSGTAARAIGWAVAAAGVAGAVGLDLRLGLFQGVDGWEKPCCALLALAALGLLASPAGRGPRRAAVIGGAAAAASLAATAMLHARDAEPLGFAEPAALLAVVALVARRGSPVPAAVAAGGAAVALVLRPLAGSPGELDVILALLLALGAAGAAAAGTAARLVALDRRRRASEVRLAQRAEFARDLHDFVAHHVTGIVVRAQGARAVAERRPELAGPALAEIERAGAEALTAMRRMVGVLREAGEGRTAEGVGDVRALVAGFRLPSGAGAVLGEGAGCDALPVEVAATAHRVVLEALTNVRRHAPDASEVAVLLDRSPGEARVEVRDDGGRRARPGRGFGLAGLAERVAMVGGTLRAGPREGGGWSVEARLPVREDP